MPLIRPIQLCKRRFTSPASGLRLWSFQQSQCRVLAQLQTRGKHYDSQQRRRSQSPQQTHQNISSPHPKLPSQPSSDSPSKYHFAPIKEDHQNAPQEVQNIPRVRYIRPAIWAITVSTGIYCYLAYREAKDELTPNPAAQFRYQPAPTTPTEVITGAWQGLDTISKLAVGIIATNGAVHLGSFLAPKYWSTLWHVPARNMSYTLFTSSFVHGGPFHLLFNMWACYNFLLPTGYSPLFEGNLYHVLSFFLATGVLSGYGQHLSNAPFSAAKALRAGRLPAIFIPSGGASGALFGIFGAFCMQYPDAQVGIIFIPMIAFAASSFLPVVMAFDVYGLVRGFKFVNLGHAAHLSGALIGVGYSYFDGKNVIWKPLVGYFKQ